MLMSAFTFAQDSAETLPADGADSKSAELVVQYLWPSCDASPWCRQQRRINSSLRLAVLFFRQEIGVVLILPPAEFAPLLPEE
jgi:hypothetical protein